MDRPFCFDIGNVLCRVNLDAFTAKLVDLGHVKDTTEGTFFLEGIQAPTDIGLYALEEAVLRYFKLSHEDLMVLKKAWKHAVTPVPAMTNFLHELKDKRHVVALLSNIGFEHAKLLRKIPEYNMCIQHFSCEVGARKPTKLFFQSFLLENPGYYGSYFVDDRIENLDSAAKFGFIPIKFNLEFIKDDNDALKELKSLIKYVE